MIFFKRFSYLYVFLLLFLPVFPSICIISLFHKGLLYLFFPLSLHFLPLAFDSMSIPGNVRLYEIRRWVIVPLFNILRLHSVKLNSFVRFFFFSFLRSAEAASAQR